MSVRTLVDRCIAMEERAWRELIATHRTAVLRMLARTGAGAEIQDLEQEVWSKLLARDCDALRSLGEVTASGLKAFICRTAINVALDHRRRQMVRRVVQPGTLEEVGIHIPDPGEGADVLFERAERKETIFETLEEILTPPNVDRDRMIFKAHYVDGLSATEIAAMGVGLQAKGVETLLLRLAGRVRAALAKKKEDAA